MIRYLIGIDGGGSKTRLLCTDFTGRRLASGRIGGTYYRQDGIAKVIAALQDGIAQIAPPEKDEIAICFGMPGYGENGKQDIAAAEEIAAAFAPIPMCFQNDVAAGWAGALALSPGINIAGGTGSMSYGRDPSGKSARCGGWHEFFSDEGSGYWLGKKTLQLFSRQSDGRSPKTMLYALVKERLGLTDDCQIVDLAEQHFFRSRKNTAALQPILLEAARAGDPDALTAYAQAAKELALIICGTAAQLNFESAPINVSYVGGLFHIKDLILEPMKHAVSQRMCAAFHEPALSPCEGAILLAAEAFAKDRLCALKKNLLQLKTKEGK